MCNQTDSQENERANYAVQLSNQFPLTLTSTLTASVYTHGQTTGHET